MDYQYDLEVTEQRLEKAKKENAELKADKEILEQRNFNQMNEMKRLIKQVEKLQKGFESIVKLLDFTRDIDLNSDQFSSMCDGCEVSNTCNKLYPMDVYDKSICGDVYKQHFLNEEE
jgi:hypothetical protein